MPDSSLLRTSRELFLSALAGDALELDARVLARLSAQLEEESVAAGRRLFAAGEPVDHVYFMREGRVRVERTGAPSWIIDGEGAFGAFEAALGRPHARTGVALTSALLLKMRAEAWFELLEDEFDLARSVVAEGLRRVASLEVRRWALHPGARGDVRAEVPRASGPLTFEDRVAVLMTVPVLRTAGVQVLADLAQSLEERAFASGETVHARGVAANAAYIVIDGEIAGTRGAPDVSVTFGPGSVVCGASWLGAPQLAWETRARGTARVLVLDAEQWFDAMEEHVALLRAALGTIAGAIESLLENLAASVGDLTVTV